MLSSLERFHPSMSTKFLEMVNADVTDTELQDETSPSVYHHKLRGVSTSVACSWYQNIDEILYQVGNILKYNNRRPVVPGSFYDFLFSPFKRRKPFSLGKRIRFRHFNQKAINQFKKWGRKYNFGKGV